MVQLASQALDKDSRYEKIGHNEPKPGDLVLIKESLSKRNQFPMGKVCKVHKNINNEVTHLEVKNGKTGRINRLHSSVIIPFLKLNEATEPSQSAIYDAASGPNERPVRSAAVVSRDRTRKVLLNM